MGHVCHDLTSKRSTLVSAVEVPQARQPRPTARLTALNRSSSSLDDFVVNIVVVALFSSHFELSRACLRVRLSMYLTGTGARIRHGHGTATARLQAYAAPCVSVFDRRPRPLPKRRRGAPTPRSDRVDPPARWDQGAPAPPHRRTWAPAARPV